MEVQGIQIYEMIIFDTTFSMDFTKGVILSVDCDGVCVDESMIESVEIYFTPLHQLIDETTCRFKEAILRLYTGNSIVIRKLSQILPQYPINDNMFKIDAMDVKKCDGLTYVSSKVWYNDNIKHYMLYFDDMWHNIQ